jgi:hypothetical protein
VINGVISKQYPKRYFLITKNMNIWQALPKPILILAPMDDVTDVDVSEVRREYGVEG